MALKDDLTNDLKTALKAREKLRLGTVRMLLSDLRNEEIKKNSSLTEQEEISFLSTQAKRRRESIDAFEKGDRPDLAEKEQAELVVIMSYLPEQLTADEVKEILRDIINTVKATSKKDLGRVMGAAMPRIKGRFSGKEVRVFAEELLS